MGRIQQKRMLHAWRDPGSLNQPIVHDQRSTEWSIPVCMIVWDSEALCSGALNQLVIHHQPVHTT
eukprot:7464153-Alexandrium_andersonii.AAC.1